MFRLSGFFFGSNSRRRESTELLLKGFTKIFTSWLNA